MDLLDFELRSDIRPTNPRILLDAGPPRALYKVNPRLILGEEWWQKTRKKAYNDFLNMCAACGASYVELQAHELYTVNTSTGKVYLRDVVPLCKDCHSFVHQDLHRALLKNGKLKSSDVTRIINHGKAVLKKAGIRAKRKDPNANSIPHSAWRLVLNGREYSPIFEDNSR